MPLSTGPDPDWVLVFVGEMGLPRMDISVETYRGNTEKTGGGGRRKPAWPSPGQPGESGQVLKAWGTGLGIGF